MSLDRGIPISVTVVQHKSHSQLSQFILDLIGYPGFPILWQKLIWCKMNQISTWNKEKMLKGYMNA